MVLFQQFQIHTGFAVKAIGECLGYQIAQIFITCTILAQQNKMVRIVVNSVDPVRHPAAGNIHFTANNGLNAGSLGSLIKIDTAIHNAMVGNCNGRLPQFLNTVHHRTDSAGAIQQTIFCMDMQMYKTHTNSSWAKDTSFFSR